MVLLIRDYIKSNLKIFILLFLTVWCNTIFSQNLSTTELTSVLLKVDSIEKEFTTEKYEKKDFTGKIDSSFGEVQGVVFFKPRFCSRLIYASLS